MAKVSTTLSAAEIDYSKKGWEIARAIDNQQFEAGDWWVLGEDMGYGVRVSMVSDASWTGYKAKMLANCGSVCRAFPAGHRWPALSFRHHEKVCCYSPGQRATLLDWAAAPTQEGKPPHPSTRLRDHAASLGFFPSSPKSVKKPEPDTLPASVERLRLLPIEDAASECTFHTTMNPKVRPLVECIMTVLDDTEDLPIRVTTFQDTTTWMSRLLAKHADDLAAEDLTYDQVSEILDKLEKSQAETAGIIQMYQDLVVEKAGKRAA